MSEMFTEQQAAKMLGCSVAALRKWRLLGKVRIPGHVNKRSGKL
jgi:hypothetical protein